MPPVLTSGLTGTVSWLATGFERTAPPLASTRSSLPSPLRSAAERVLRPLAGEEVAFGAEAAVAFAVLDGKDAAVAHGEVGDGVAVEVEEGDLVDSCARGVRRTGVDGVLGGG